MFDHFVGLAFFSIKQNHQIHGKANFYFMKDKIIIVITHKFFSKTKYIYPGYIAKTERRWGIQKTSRTSDKGLYYFNLRVLSWKIRTTNPCGGWIKKFLLRTCFRLDISVEFMEHKIQFPLYNLCLLACGHISVCVKLDFSLWQELYFFYRS